MTAFTLLLCLAAFAGFGLATDEHYGRRLGRRLAATTKRRLQKGAWITLAAAFPVAVLAQGWVYGPLLWCGAAMAGAGVVFLVLNLAPPQPQPKSGDRP